jgi:hypothetical protein
VARGAGLTGAWLFQELLLDVMTTYTRRGSLATALRIKLMKVFYVSGV